MDRDTKIGHLNFAGLVDSHLQDAIVLLEHKVLQTNLDIQELVNRLEAVKNGTEEVNEDDVHEGLAMTAIEAFGKSINHMPLALANMEHKRDVFQLALTSVRDASVELNRFANAIPGIPTMDD